MKIMILGANGFIGSALTAAIIQGRPDWEVYHRLPIERKAEA